MMLPVLPHDILAEICSHLGQEWQSIHLQDKPDYYCEAYHTLHRTLVSLSTTSQALHTAVEPHLYSVFSGHAIFDAILFRRTLQYRPDLARHLKILNIDVYHDEWIYGLVPRPPVNTWQKTWQQVRRWSERNSWLPAEFRACDPWVKSAELPSAELWADLVRLATNLQVLQMHTPRSPPLQLLNAVRDMATGVITSAPDSASDLPLSRLQILSTSLRPIGRRPSISCVDLTPQVPPYDWSASAMLLPHLRSFNASFTRCEDPYPLAEAAGLHIAKPNLRTLTLHHCAFDDTFLRGMLTLNPHLRKLEVLHFPYDEQDLNGTRLLQTIVTLGSKIEHLAINTGEPYHESTLNDFVHGCPSFRPLGNLHTLEIDLSALIDTPLEAGTTDNDMDLAHHLHHLLPPYVEALTLLPRQWYLKSRAFAPCRRRLRVWLGSDYRPSALRKLCVGISLRKTGEKEVFEIGGEMWVETDLGGRGGRTGYARAFEVVRLG